ncbi:MAG: peptidylprolyl isomerase [Bacteriovoracaceae bacterium]|nr:peptidylprolyl isomerase [Bacteriovoracaceae bacterium]
MARVNYRARHILLGDLDEAKEIVELIRQGQDFGDLAREYSECETAAKGGELGSFFSGKMVPEFERALYHLEDGEVSRPIKSKFGYHIIQRLKS